MCKLRNPGNPVSHVNSLPVHFGVGDSTTDYACVCVRYPPLPTPHINDFVNKHWGKPSLHCTPAVCEHTYALSCSYYLSSLQSSSGGDEVVCSPETPTKSEPAHKSHHPLQGLKMFSLEAAAAALSWEVLIIVWSDQEPLFACFVCYAICLSLSVRLQELDAMWLSFGFEAASCLVVIEAQSFWTPVSSCVQSSAR